MSAPRLVVLTIACWLGGAAVGSPVEERIAALYRPFEAEAVTLSPDGRHIAYTRHVKNQLTVVIVAVDDPSQRTNVIVDEDRDVLFSKEKKRAALRYLAWVGPNRLVMVPSEETVDLPAGANTPPVAARKLIAPFLAVDGDGANAKTVATAADFSVALDLAPPAAEERQDVTVYRATSVIGRIPGDPAHLLVAALGMPALRRGLPAVPTTLFEIDVNAGQVKPMSEEYELGKYLYDWKGEARIVYAQPEHSLTRGFSHRLPGSRWRDPGAAGPGSLPAAFAVTPDNYYGERSIPLGFDLDPQVLIYASNVGRDTYGIYGLNVATGRRTDFAIEHPYLDLASLEPAFPSPTLVFDPSRGSLAGVRAVGARPFTIWCDVELARMQRTLDAKFPQRTVEMLDWDAGRDRFLVRVSSGSEPGRYFIYKKKENLPVEFLRRTPWLKAADLSESADFEFDAKSGVHLTGILTRPRASRLNPPPLLVYLPETFPAQPQPEFDREAQVLAAMGFIVVRLNHRGTAGFGQKHRNAIQPAADRVPLEDITAVLDYLPTRWNFDARRVAIMGQGFGGYLALRALQLEPERFRCAIALDAPLDLEQWLRDPLADDLDETPAVDFDRAVQRAFWQRSARGFKDASVLRAADRLTKPVFLIVNPQRDEEIGRENQRLRGLLRASRHEPEYLELTSDDFALGLPAARTRVFHAIEEFFNLNLYDYKVKLGPVEEKK